MRQFFDQTEALNILHGFNPWWSGRSHAYHDFRRLAFEPCRRYLEDTSLRRAILLSGPRRVGKTTILLQIADYLIKEEYDPKGVFYSSLDHLMIKLLSLQKILNIYNDFIYPKGKETFLLTNSFKFGARNSRKFLILCDHLIFFQPLKTSL